MRLILILARTYPWRSAGIVLCLILGSAVTGLGTAAMLPTLAALAAGDRGGEIAPESELESIVLGGLGAMGLEPSLEVLISVMVGMALARAALVIPTNRLIGNAVARFARDLRIRLVRAITRARWSYLTGQRVGVLSAGFASEADRSAGAFLAATTLVAEALKVALFIGLASLVSWKVTGGGIAIGALLGVGLASFVRAARRAGAKQTRLTREALSRLQSTLVSLKPLKAMARESTLGTLLDADTDRLFRTVKRLVMTSETLRALQETLIALTVAALAYSVLRFLEMPFQSLLVLLFLFVRMLGSVSKVQRGFQELVALESAYLGLIETIQAAEAAAEPILQDAHTPPPKRLEEAVELRDVSVAYDQDIPVLEDFSLRIPAGKITALVGPSGCGKTTVADLVCGLVSPGEGEVSIDGTPLAEIDLHAWREQLGYVAQDTLLLRGTVLDNVRQDDPRVDREAARSALRDAQALTFVEENPEGLETPVGTGGAMLSGGQRQRVAIARALAHRPALLILDEATSALDPDTEAAVYRAIQERDDGITVLAISHQDALLEIADQVYQFEQRREVTTPHFATTLGGSQ